MDNGESEPTEEQNISEPDNPGEIFEAGERPPNEQPPNEPENPGEPIEKGAELPESDDN